AANTSSTSRGAVRHPSAAASTSETVSTISVKPAFPARNAATNCSLAALYTAGTHPPSAAACRANDTAGNTASSNGSKVQLAAVSHRHGGAAAGTRCGQCNANEIGRRMSGGLACAMVDPSRKVTIECTTDCGCTTTSIRSAATPNNNCASISSSPLFTMVAELMVTTGPMSHVGCAIACSSVTSANSVVP